MSLRNALLGLLTYSPMTGYDLKNIFEKSINYFWSASTSQIYRELGVLEKDGYVTSHIEPQEGKPDKKVYTLSDKGKDAFLDWLNKFPTSLQSPVREDFMVRVFFASYVSPNDLKFEFQRYIKEQQLMLGQLESQPPKRPKMDLKFTEHEVFFWRLTKKAGLIFTKAAITWAEECIKEIDEYMRNKK